jgi:hypothetical protein
MTLSLANHPPLLPLFPIYSMKKLKLHFPAKLLNDMPLLLETPQAFSSYGISFFPRWFKWIPKNLFILIQVKVRLIEGQISAGILSKDKSNFIDETALSTRGESTIELLVLRQHCSELIIRNFNDNQPSLVEIQAIHCYLLPKRLSLPDASLSMPADQELRPMR